MQIYHKLSYHLRVLNSIRILRCLKSLEYEEAKIMKNVPGWVVGENVYHNDRWVTPNRDQLTNY